MFAAAGGGVALRPSADRHVGNGAGEMDRDICGWWALPPAACTRKRANPAFLVFSALLIGIGSKTTAMRWRAGGRALDPSAERDVGNGGGGGP